MDVLLRYNLLHVAAEASNGSWLAQICPRTPIRFLQGPHEVLELVADFQQQLRDATDVTL
ncbi:hypothetical protein ACFS5L_02485 [Streptomyces phyllanthi]|uniref:Uncharacterized protein n=2 Tax=Streptomyces phyllanthi TaxID=1803180 RepID=A0A5N8VTF3_9ACTN|nr:hypothetical protein [Streptomyces phyllanthi]